MVENADFDLGPAIGEGFYFFACVPVDLWFKFHLGFLFFSDDHFVDREGVVKEDFIFGGFDGF